MYHIIVCVSFPGMDFNVLRDEITSLEELSRHLFLEIVELRNMQERAEWSRTWKGIYFNFLGYFFSLYCMWKIFIVSYPPCTLPIISSLSQNTEYFINFFPVHRQHRPRPRGPRRSRNPWPWNLCPLDGSRNRRSLLVPARLLYSRGVHSTHLHPRFAPHPHQILLCHFLL